MLVSQVDQDQIKKPEMKGSKKKHRVKHMHSPMNLNCLNHWGDFGWGNYSTNVYFDVDPNSSHRPDKCRQEPAKKYRSEAKKMCCKDKRPERTRTIRSK